MHITRARRRPNVRPSGQAVPDNPGMPFASDPNDKEAASPRAGSLFGRLRMRHLVAIEILAERKNIRQASQALFLSQPAASKLLQEIESIFEARLFERTAHGVEITPQGEVLLHWARKAMGDMDAARAEIGALRDGWEGRVRVGVFPVAAPVLVPDAVALLRRSRPGIQVELREGLETTLLPQLEKGQLDCVIGRATPLAGARGLSHETLFEEPTVVVCAVDHPLLESSDWTNTDIDRYEWILPARSGQLYALVASGLARRGAALPRVAVETSSILTLVEILRQSQLLSAIASGVARRFLEIGLLRTLELPLSASLHPVAIITNHAASVHPPLSMFLDAVREVCAKRSHA